MRALLLAASLVASALLVFALAPHSEAHADITVPAGWPLIPSGLDVGDKFRLLFVTHEQTALPRPSFSYSFFDNYVRDAVSNGGSNDVRPYADEFNVLASCGRTSAFAHTSTAYTASDRGVPIYYLGGDKVADDYADFYDGGWDSHEARNERGDLTGGRDVFTGSNPNGTPRQGFWEMNICSDTVSTGKTAVNGKELYAYLSSRDSPRSLYGLSGVFTVSVAPGLPEALEVVSTSYNTASIGWNAPAYSGSTPVHDYDVQFRQTGGSWAQSVPAHHGTGTSLTLTGLSPNTEYEVQVRANNHGADQSGAASSTVRGPWSPSVDFYTQSDVPAAPDRPAVTAGMTSAVLSWETPVRGAAPIHDYDVQFRQAGGSWNESTPEAHGTSTTLTLEDLSPDTMYQVRVHANNSHGSGPWSQVVTFTTLDHAPVPGAPGAPAVQPSATTAAVSWDAPDGSNVIPVDDYDVAFRQDGGIWQDAGFDGTGTTLTLEDLSPDTRYDVRVRANNSQGSGPWSPVTEFNTAAASLPSVPVPNTWSLKPDGLGTGDEFRLLFVTSSGRNAESSDPRVYNAFVQREAANGHADIITHAESFRAVVQTTERGAADNTFTMHASDNPGLPVYWLGGDKVADDYDDFYGSCWDSNAARDRDGDALRETEADSLTGDDAIRVWTGLDQGNGWPGDPLGGHFVTAGTATKQCDELDNGLSPASSDVMQLYALSPVFTVS